MAVILREALLGVLGIESDLNWGTSAEGVSAIDSELIPPGSGALLSRIAELGKNYKYLEAVTKQQQESPYLQAIYNSIENYLDTYRAAIVKADSDISSGKLATLTWLVAIFEPFQHELAYIGRVVPPLTTMHPLEILGKIHSYITSSPPSIATILSSFEGSLHQVLISQLNDFVFYHQSLPGIFEALDTGRIGFFHSLPTSFIPFQLSELLLLIVNVVYHSSTLFDSANPPQTTQLTIWIDSVARITSQLLSMKLNEQWPQFFSVLSSVFLIGRSDIISALARKLIQPHCTSFELNAVLSSFGFEKSVTMQLSSAGVGIAYDRKPPLDIIVTDDQQRSLSEMFSVFMYLSSAEEAADDLWGALRRHRKAQMVIGFVQKLFSSIKEHIVFVVIGPALTSIEGEKITDFLKFQAEVSAFFLKLSSGFPTADVKFRETVRSFCQKIVSLRELLVGKDMVEEMEEGQIMEEIANVGRAIVAGMNQASIVSQSDEETGGYLAQTQKRVLECIEVSIKQKK